MFGIDLDQYIKNSSDPQTAINSAVGAANNLRAQKNKAPLNDREIGQISTAVYSNRKFRVGGSSSTGGGSSSAGAGESAFFKGAEKLMSGVDKTISFTADRFKEAYKSQMGKSNYSGDDSAVKILSAIGKGGIAASIPNVIETMYDEILDQLTQESQLLSEINTKTGISGELSKELQYDMKAAQGEAKKYGFELSDIGKFYTDLSEQSGKFSLINKTTIEDAAKTAAALGMSLSEMATTIGDYEKVGIGAKETMKSVGDTAVRSISLGLNARKVADGMKDSIGKLNEFGFKNGIEGLERMVRKSVEFKISMESVSSIAEKVLNPEGAIDLAANLQVLGGAIGDFGDPIKMMYDATNNMEGLQDSLIGAASGLATYNQEQKRFEITGINLRRAREMASSLGMSMSDLTKTAVAAQERMAASTALMSTGLQMDEKEKEFLTNLSRMQDGEMKIVVPESLQDKLGKQSEITLSKLTEEQKAVLIANKKAFEDMTPEKMAMAQLTETQKMGRNMEVIAAYVKVRAAATLRGGAGELLKSQLETLKNTIAGVDTSGNPKQDEEDARNKIKNLSMAGVKSAVTENAQKLQEGLKEKVQNITNPLSQQQPQEVKHTYNILSNVGGDAFAEAARKNAAFGFSLNKSNPREYT